MFLILVLVWSSARNKKVVSWFPKITLFCQFRPKLTKSAGLTIRFMVLGQNMTNTICIHVFSLTLRFLQRSIKYWFIVNTFYFPKPNPVYRKLKYSKQRCKYMGRWWHLGHVISFRHDGSVACSPICSLYFFGFSCQKFLQTRDVNCCFVAGYTSNE